MRVSFGDSYNGDNMVKEDNYKRFGIKNKGPLTPYGELCQREQAKKIGVSLALWSANERLDETTRSKLKKMNVDKVVSMLTKFDAWSLYGNRRKGLVLKVQIIIENYEREYGKIKVD